LGVSSREDNRIPDDQHVISRRPVRRPKGRLKWSNTIGMTFSQKRIRDRE
jgi:hypothetical protein